MNIAITGELADELANTAPDGKRDNESIGDPPIYEEVPGAPKMPAEKDKIEPEVKIEEQPEAEVFAVVKEAGEEKNEDEEEIEITQMITRRANGQVIS